MSAPKSRCGRFIGVGLFLLLFEMPSSDKKWFPLEANPDVMNKYIRDLGVEGATVADIFGLDDELLAMVPQPVLAVLMLYPITAENDAAADHARSVAAAAPSSAFFMLQTVSNACGTVGIVHAVANNTAALRLREDGVMRRLLRDTADASPADRAQWFEKDDALESAQAAAAQEGQTSNQAIDADINLHFICLTSVGGRLVEFDGRKSTPLDLGECPPEALLQRAAGRAKEVMALNPNEVNFTLVAVCKEEE